MHGRRAVGFAAAWPPALYLLPTAGSLNSAACVQHSLQFMSLSQHCVSCFLVFFHQLVLYQTCLNIKLELESLRDSDSRLYANSKRL